MSTKYSKRGRTRVADLASGFPHVPAFDGEDALDTSKVASDFVSSFSSAVTNADWNQFADLFIEDSWWKDSLTLTFDKRTIHGRSAIHSAWKTLAEDHKRKPSEFSNDPAGTWGMGPQYTRFAPTLACLDVPFSFCTEEPRSRCVGQAKLVPVDGKWLIWILSTAVDELIDHPFKQLPRQSKSSVDGSQRGKASAQGLPNISGVLDVVVIGGSSSGLANTIMLDSAGADVAVFDVELEAGGNWSTSRYSSVVLHHNNLMVQLPMFPVPSEGYPEYMGGRDLTRYMSAAVEQLKLPFFGGIQVIGNTWHEDIQCWAIDLKDIQSGNTSTIKAKNLVLSNGFFISKANPYIPSLEGRDSFKGPVQHTSEYRDATLYKDLDVVVVGSGNSAHDVAKDLALNGVKSVTMLQRSPTTLFDFDVFSPIISMRYQGQMPVEAADFQETSLPLGVMRDMASGMIASLNQAMEARHKLLEGKGYQVEQGACLPCRAYEERGKSFYVDQEKVFDMVLSDRIRIARGEAKGLDSEGLVVYDKDEDKTKTIPAGGVVLATGYKDEDLPKKYAEAGFIDEESAAKLENVSVPAVDEEGESPGYVTYSGHPHLYFAGIGFYMCRWIGRYVAVQIMADVTGKFPERYTRS
ncbi:flavin-containing monooxygenase [Fusarium longipes]|uniref:Flavin-containing monooxygenase n=1 Tax=Fusarium longipes TaxID=694270 RepID=A0A395SHN0_9HYPO|nr:flavin-containing monooxygenase [Fusarium longipes]